MQTSVFRSTSLRVGAIGFAVMLAHAVVPAAFAVDCGSLEGHLCRQCCSVIEQTPEQYAVCQQRPSCCAGNETNPFCNSVIGVPIQISPIRLNALLGGVKLTFKRKGLKDGSVDVKLKEALVSMPTFRKSTMSVGAQLTGADAALGSLLYPVAFLTLGESALATLQARGYDIAIAKAAAAQTCQDVLPEEVCTALAKQLARSLYALIAVGADGERAAFLDGIEALGHGPCNIREG